MDISKQEQALIVLAEELNKQSIPWALGGSMLLWYKGIVNQVQDLDIMILEQDEKIVSSIIQTIGTIQPQHKRDNQECHSTVFIEAVINGIDVDIIGGFTIDSNNEAHYCPLQVDKIEHIHIDDTVIYLDSLELWKTYYTLMGRTTRANQIAQFLTE
ncbi:hypothetical protein [Candidatus Xianfuyuplasma coldseepsis]|uniref:Nucleotidyltransferase family protein n=1 Tax=Candidatus Xianfuyuplasma coldseepsis TaxID=2782163 RepID=A0A7L7KTZ5_9MOLU|nr:hypothetical protein [Xianfuyuplasma coldseepsis]QMS85474.1 hypothetical protein G4Z02_06865 [Xianfuyuplasma coldseepsis]